MHQIEGKKSNMTKDWLRGVQVSHMLASHQGEQSPAIVQPPKGRISVPCGKYSSRRLVSCSFLKTWTHLSSSLMMTLPPVLWVLQITSPAVTLAVAAPGRLAAGSPGAVTVLPIRCSILLEQKFLSIFFSNLLDSQAAWPLTVWLFTNCVADVWAVYGQLQAWLSRVRSCVWCHS